MTWQIDALSNRDREAMVVSQARWDWMQHIRHPFYRSVAVDGIDITAVRELA